MVFIVSCGKAAGSHTAQLCSSEALSLMFNPHNLKLEHLRPRDHRPATGLKLQVDTLWRWI